MIRIRLAALLLVVSVCLSWSASAQVQQKPTMAGYPAVGSPAIVRLIAPGAEPRRAIRYAIPATYKGAMTMTTSMEMSGLPVAMAPMTIEMGLDLAVTSVATNGDITYMMTFTKAGLGPGADPAMAGAIQGAMQAVVGMKGTATISNRGVMKTMNLDLDKAKDPAMGQALGQVSQTLENMAAAFPEEPIGIGARWEVRTAVETGGIISFQRSEFEVASLSATSMGVKLRMEQTAPPQQMSNPQMPAEVQIMIERYATSGAGTGTIPLNGLIPTMSMDMNSSMSMAVSAAGQQMPMNMEMKLKTVVAPAKANK